MSIDSIQPRFISISAGSPLRAVTIQTLIALGIDPNTVSSEEEALALIQKILMQRVEIAKTSLNNKKEHNAEADIIISAKALATDVGITLPNAPSIDQMFGVISEQIEALEKNGNNANIKEYKSELDLLKKSYFDIKKNEDDFFSSMDYNANLNKMILGL